MKAKEAIAINLKRIRQDKGLSQVQVAEKAGVTQAAYSRIETGTNWPDHSTLEAVAKALKCAETDITSHPDLLEAFKRFDKIRNE